ncbi:unnamed protein product, partial [Mesorhabditis spiculigera]
MQLAMANLPYEIPHIANIPLWISVDLSTKKLEFERKRKGVLESLGFVRFDPARLLYLPRYQAHGIHFVLRLTIALNEFPYNANVDWDLPVLLTLGDRRLYLQHAVNGYTKVYTSVPIKNPEYFCVAVTFFSKDYRLHYKIWSDDLDLFYDGVRPNRWHPRTTTYTYPPEMKAELEPIVLEYDKKRELRSNGWKPLRKIKSAIDGVDEDVYEKIDPSDYDQY